MTLDSAWFVLFRRVAGTTNLTPPFFILYIQRSTVIRNCFDIVIFEMDSIYTGKGGLREGKLTMAGRPEPEKEVALVMSLSLGFKPAFF